MPATFRRMTGIALAVCALLAGLAILATQASAEHRQPRPNPLELRDLLLAERFHEVERRLVSYQSDFENAVDTEYLAAAGFRAFTTSNPAIADPLDAWVAAMPESWAALAARGLYREKIGWLKRGSRMARETSAKRFAGMREQFALAERDLRAALELNPHIMPAYDALMVIAMATSRKHEIDDILAAGLEVEPASYIIRNAYLHTLQPKWGGSEQAMAAFVEASMKWLDKNPDLKSLEMTLRLRRVNRLFHARQYKQALDLVNPLVEEWGNTDVLFARGGAFYYLGNYDRALAEYRRVVDHAPYWATALGSVAGTLARLNRNDEALRYHDLAVRLEPMDPEVLMARSYEYERQGRFREAIGDQTDALVHGWDNALFWERRAMNKADGLRDDAAAIPDFEKALEFDPGMPRTWRLYGYSLVALKKCEALEAFKYYRQICEANKACDDEYYGAIDRKAKRLVEEANCTPGDG